MLNGIDTKSHSYLLGMAESNVEHLRKCLADLVDCVKDDLARLPDGYRARLALDRAVTALAVVDLKDAQDIIDEQKARAMIVASQETK